jgi:CubicO group peptidase (beta-lactamase class C family)
MTMRKCVCLISLLVSITAFAATDKARAIEELLKQYHQQGLLNGTVLVADHGQILYEGGFGYANFEWRVPNTPDTKFRIGSVTKPFTAILVLQQVRSGKIDVDAPITKYLPEYRKDTGDRVLVRHLLTHTSGIPTYIGSDIEKWTSPIPRATFMSTYCSGDLESEPGAEFSYNNCGYFLLAEMLERATGKSYAELLRQGISGPAGMLDTGVDDGKTVLRKRASGYDKNYLRGEKPARFTEITTAVGAGDLYSTAEDLFRFDRALYTDKLLPADFRKMMFTPVKGPAAMGWFVSTAGKDHPAAGQTIQQHEGNIFGYFSMIQRVPEREAFIAVLDNTHLDSFDDICHDILAILYDKPYAPPKPLVADTIAATLLREGAAAAAKQYRELKQRQSDKYQWGGLNSLGQDLLDAGRTKDAIAVFQLSVENAPQSWFSQFNLAEAYKANGEVEQANIAYDAALKLNTAKPFKRMIEAAKAK